MFLQANGTKYKFHALMFWNVSFETDSSYEFLAHTDNIRHVNRIDILVTTHARRTSKQCFTRCTLWLALSHVGGRQPAQ